MADLTPQDADGTNVDSFSAFQNQNRMASFTDWLRERSEPDWSEAVRHPFTKELSQDELDRECFRAYLVQDLDFVETLIGAFGYLVGQADTMETRSRVSQFLATVTSEENDYFERALDALDVEPDRYRDPEPNEVNAGFQEFLLSTVKEDRLENTLAVLLPVEWVYYCWADAVSDEEPESFYFREWIDLHHNPAFNEFVDHLRERMDQLGPDLPPERQEEVAELFTKTVRYEVEFFDAVYERQAGNDSER